MSASHPTAMTGSGGPSALGEAGKAIALAVVLTMGTVYVPLVSAVFVFLLPLPVAYVTSRHGAGTGVSVAVGTGLLAALLTGPVNGVTAFFLAGVVGLMLGLGLARRWGFSSVLLTTTAATAVSLAALIGAAWMITGMSVAELQTVIDESFASARELYISAGMDRETVLTAEGEARDFLGVLPYLAPGLLAVLGLVYASLAGALAAVVFPRMGQDAAAHLSFSRFRLHWGVAYGFILGFGMLVLSGYAPAAQGTLQLVGLNVFLFFMALYFLQGMALARWYDRSRGLGGLGKTALYGSAVLAQAFLMLTSWIGLLDTWFDYRKRLLERARRRSADASGEAQDDHKE